MSRPATVHQHGRTLVCIDDGEPLTLETFYVATSTDPDEAAEIEVDLWMLGAHRFGGDVGAECVLRLVG